MTEYRTIETRADAFHLRRNRFRIRDVLRRGLGVWGKNLVPFTVLSLVLHAPLIIWAVALLTLDAPLEAYLRFNRWNALGLHVINSLLAAAVTYGVVMELDRRPTTIARVVVTGLRRFLPAAAVTFVAGLATFVAGLLLVIPGIIVMCMVHVAVPASVIERPGVIGALRRSRALTAGNRLRILGLIVLAFVVGMIFTVAVQGVVFGFGPERAYLFPVSDLIRSVVLGPLVAALVATTYVLLRQQRDGVDTSALVEVFR